MQLSEILKEWQPQVAKSNRASINSDIIALYRSEQETKLRRLKNIERYKIWLRENRIRHSTENAFKFKKSKSFIKELEDKRICIMLGYIKTEDLYLVYSNCKDIYARGKSVASYIFDLAYPKTGDKFDTKK